MGLRFIRYLGMYTVALRNDSPLLAVGLFVVSIVLATLIFPMQGLACMVMVFDISPRRMVAEDGKAIEGYFFAGVMLIGNY
jgi:hypothetical protein